MKQILFYCGLFFIANFVSAQKKDSVKYQIKQLIFTDDFDKNKLDTNWITEYDLNEKDAITIRNKQLVIDTKGGFTCWYKNKLSGNILIEYDRTVILDSGKNDRLSDLNQFWMATDPQQKMFNRKGGFKEYDSLQMYYVGMGGNYNTTTRMRRYSNGHLKIIGEFTDESHLLKPNKTYHIKIIIQNGVSSFLVDNELFFTFKDEQPFIEGWFALRSTKSKQVINGFKIWRLE